MSEHRKYKVLFLCTGNSARSIMAEALANFPLVGQGRLQAYSAGSNPLGQVNPWALKTLERHGLPTGGLRSKNWSEFEGPDAPQMDFVFTVCGNAASEICPVWPGHPLTAHWGVEDPAVVEGDESLIAHEFNEAFLILKRRIELFVALPFEKIDDHLLHDHLHAIGGR